MPKDEKTLCKCGTPFNAPAIVRVEFWATDFPDPIVMRIGDDDGLKACPHCVPSALHFLRQFKPLIDKLCGRYSWVKAHVIRTDGEVWEKVARWQFDESLN